MSGTTTSHSLQRVEEFKKRKFLPFTHESCGCVARGQQVTARHLIDKGFFNPILFERPDGLEMKIPDKETFTVEYVASTLGDDYQLDVIDVVSQSYLKITMGELAEEFRKAPAERSKIHNCITLEVSRSQLGDMIEPPKVVRKLSWVENSWPKVDFRPNVSKYCLLSMEKSFTDFHIDFGGTSVWYHVLRGEKIFYLIRPTPSNLKVFEDWSRSTSENGAFFSDIAHQINGDEGNCYILTLHEGQTLFLPTGWIHAVLTTKDSMVLGGNFLHSLNIKTQLQIHEMEGRIQTPDKYKFPYFEYTHWYAAALVVKLFRDSFKDKVPLAVMVEGLEALIDKLKSWLSVGEKENTGENGDSSCYAPRGFACRKLIQDLQRELKQARDKRKEHQEYLEKKGKKRPLPKIIYPNEEHQAASESQYHVSYSSTEDSQEDVKTEPEVNPFKVKKSE